MAAEETDSTGDRERCTKRFALNARKNAKYRSNPLKASRFIAEIASQSEKDIKRL